MSFLKKPLTLFSRRINCLSPVEYVWLCIFRDLCVIIRFNPDFSRASAVAFHSDRAAYVRSAYIALISLLRGVERSEESLRIRVQ